MKSAAVRPSSVAGLCEAGAIRMKSLRPRGVWGAYSPPLAPRPATEARQHNPDSEVAPSLRRAFVGAIGRSCRDCGRRALKFVRHGVTLTAVRVYIVEIAFVR